MQLPEELHPKSRQTLISKDLNKVKIEHLHFSVVANFTILVLTMLVLLATKSLKIYKGFNLEKPLGVKFYTFSHFSQWNPLQLFKI